MTVSASTPETLDEALDALSGEPGALVLAGGTDLLVAVNAGRLRPWAVVDVSQVRSLRGWSRREGRVILGAGLTYTDMMRPDLAAVLPALAYAARTVGSPQIRNAGTLGGNLGTASPAGDALPVLAALDAEIVLRGPEGERVLTWPEFLTGPKQSALRPGELIVAARVAVPRGLQEFCKVGTRNAMVIAVASVALVVDLDARRVRCALGSAGPTPLRAPVAEDFAAAHLDWDVDSGPRAPDPRTYEAFGDLVGEAARPIDDHRSTADYRRHAVAVCARRALARVCGEGTR
ncbi:MAG: FAD binding domain-containing protein [Actinomycetes bacterium]